MTSTVSKPLKHVNDVCRLNKESPRSESVKGLSLDDVIAEKKIAGPPRSDKGKNGSIANGGFNKSRGDYLSTNGSSVDDLNVSLDEIIKRRRPAEKTDKDKTVDADKEKTVDADQALDAIIQQKKKEVGGKRSLEDEAKPTMNGVNQNGSSGGGVIEPFVGAPLDVLMKLTEEGLVIQCEIGRVAEGAENAGRKHTWRVKYSCGEVSVRCDSSRKNLAKQGAANQFLTELKEAEPSLEIPPFKVPEAAYYDPVVVNRLEELVAVMSLGPARFETVQSRMSQHDYFTTTYYIGDDEFSGSSFNSDHAKVLAAKQAYEVFSGKTFPKDSFLLGEKCAQGLEYDMRETEATHVITLTANPSMMNGYDESTTTSSTALSRKRSAVRKPEPEQSKISDPDDAEIFVDDSGQMYVRSNDGSNKIRKISPVTLDDYASLANIQFPAGDTEENDDNDIFDPMSLLARESGLGLGDGGIDDEFDYEDM